MSANHRTARPVCPLPTPEVSGNDDTDDREPESVFTMVVPSRTRSVERPALEVGLIDDCRVPRKIRIAGASACAATSARGGGRRGGLGGREGGGRLAARRRRPPAPAAIPPATYSHIST